jgi:hypothetical protein
MTIETLGFVISFVVTYTLLGWFIIGSKGKWLIKACFSAAVVLLTLLNWNSIENMMGWSTTAPLPEKFEVLWIHVKEPSKKPQTEGGIFVMLRYMSEYESGFSLFDKKDSQEPRLFKVKYTKEKHEQAMGIIGKLKKGERVFGSNEKGKGKGKNGKGDKEGNGDEPGWNYEIEGEQLFYILPPPKLPQKNR